MNIMKKLNNFPRVGVGVMVLKDGKILLGKRKGSHGEGTWALPGGHLEFNESFDECAMREVMEETNLEIKYLEKVTFTNDIFEKEGKHYVTLFLIAKMFEGDLRIMEPNKCEKWEWFKWNDLPNPLFAPLRNLLKDGLGLCDLKKYFKVEDEN